ncbi:DUF2127 domain-containing protein [Pseudonocardia spinosispora]|uniref:DUF2127 domain-containing protein n=1 Tax=Pseudonocardia spinosispora TaxID=103441 RepID=UPI00049097CD|nr:DUF2127 domain-containing protein [Pseudonocardia spinosispora]
MRESAARTTERLFKVALVIKGIDGAAELIGAALLACASGDLVQRVIAHVVSHDLLGPPDGSLSRHFVLGTAEFASGHRTFAIVYLALHGVLKLALVAALLRKWLPAYPAAIVVLGLFVIYEVYRAAHTHSILLPFLAALDLAIIVLVIREYRLLRSETVSPER